MKNFPLIALLFSLVLLFNSCSKEISEPEQSADGSNVIYLKIDDKDKFLLEDKNKRLHRKTAGKFDDYDNDIVRYSEYEKNNAIISDFSMVFTPFNAKKAEFQKASLILRLDKQTQLLDTAFMRENLSKTVSSFVRFAVKTDEYKDFYIDSIIDYKVIKWDQEMKTFTFSANCTYSRFPNVTPTNPKIYFYLDIKYSL